LFGRSARQGDPGSYECMVALTDIKRDHLTDRLQSWALAALLNRTADLQWARVLALGLLLRQQKGLEKQHTFVRRQLLLADERNEKLLAFASEKI